MENEILINLEKIVETLNKLDVSTQNLKNFSSAISNLADAYKKLGEETKMAQLDDAVTSIKNIVEGMKGFASLKDVPKDIGDIIDNIGVHVGKFATSVGMSTGAVEALSTAFTFLSGHPIITVVGALGLIVGGLALFDKAVDESVGKNKELRESIEKQSERLEILNEDLMNNADSSKVRLDSIKGEYDALKLSVDKLEEFSNDGTSSSLEEIKFYIEEINRVLPDSVELTENNKIKWKENAEALRENIELIKQKAVAEHQMSKYQDILARELEIKREYAQAEQAYNGALREAGELRSRYNELNAEERDRLKELSSLLPELQNNYEVASYSMNEFNKVEREMELSTKALSGTVEDKAALMVEQWTTLEENGTVSFSSMAVALNEFAIKHKELSQENSKVSQEEAKVYEEAAKQTIDSMVEKAYQYGLSYSEMIEMAKKNGAQLSETDKKALQESYDAYDKFWEERFTIQLEKGKQNVLNEQLMFSELDDVQKSQLAYSLDRFNEAGSRQGTAYISKLANALKNNAATKDAVKKGLEDMQRQVDGLPVKVNIKASLTSASQAVSRWMDQIKIMLVVSQCLWFPQKHMLLVDYHKQVNYSLQEKLVQNW